MNNIETKKIIWAIGTIIVVLLIVFGINEWKSKFGQVASTHPCAINFLNTFVFNVATGTPETTIAKSLVTQFLDEYKNTPDCETLGIKDYSITSFGKATQVKKDFTVPVVFDVIPVSKEQTLWAMASTTWDGDWIRGEHVTLGIQNVSTTSAQAYRLVLQ